MISVQSRHIIASLEILSFSDSWSLSKDKMAFWKQIIRLGVKSLRYSASACFFTPGEMFPLLIDSTLTILAGGHTVFGLL